MQSYSKCLLTPCLILIMALFANAPLYATLPDGNAAFIPNPFGKVPCQEVDEIPGFTYRDLLVIFTAHDLNNAAFSLQDYAPAIDIPTLNKTWKMLRAKAYSAPTHHLSATYAKAFAPERENGDSAAEKTNALKKIYAALDVMTKDEKHWHGFYTAHKMFLLKRKLLFSIIQARETYPGTDDADISIHLAIKNLARKILALETRLLQLNIINDNSAWDKAKKVPKLAAKPLTATYKNLALGRSNNTKERAIVFKEFLLNKFDSLNRKIDTIINRIYAKDVLDEWKQTKALDSDSFDSSGKLKVFNDLPSIITKLNTSRLPQPFGLYSSAPSPIPGVSWRRLAEICRTEKQVLHAMDFGSVVDWKSFLAFMQTDPSTAHNGGLFADFLRLYSPETFKQIFTSRNHASPVVQVEVTSLQDFLENIIASLERPHNAFKAYKKRTAIAKLEAELLKKLITLHSTDSAPLTLESFPQVAYRLTIQNGAVEERFDPINVNLCLNTQNALLEKSISRLRTLDSTEIKATRMNEHSGWNTAAKVAKATPAIALAPVVLTGKAAFSTTRTASFSQHFKTKQRELRAKIQKSIEKMGHCDVSPGEFFEYISLGSLEEELSQPRSTPHVPKKAKSD